MKVKDGFKFGVGVLIAWDLYNSLCYLEKKIRKECKKYMHRTDETIEKNCNHRETFPICKNKIGFTIE